MKDFFMKNNTKQKLDELGKMQGLKLQKNNKKMVCINEKGNFVPILSNYTSYFMHIIDHPLTINSEIHNGIIYIHDPIPEKNTEQKLILLYKENEQSKDFKRPIITLNPEQKIKDNKFNYNKFNVK